MGRLRSDENLSKYVDVNSNGHIWAMSFDRGRAIYIPKGKLNLAI